jgi:hypothetical protein
VLHQYPILANNIIIYYIQSPKKILSISDWIFKITEDLPPTEFCSICNSIPNILSTMMILIKKNSATEEKFTNLVEESNIDTLDSTSNITTIFLRLCIIQYHNLK